MEHEIRYYLKQMRALMEEPAEGENREPFVPKYFITAIKLPSGEVKLTIITSDIKAEIDYILEEYDVDMHLKRCPEVIMTQLMIV